MEQTILLVHTNNQAQTCLIPFGCGSGTSVDFIYVPSFNTFVCFPREGKPDKTADSRFCD